MRNKNPRNSENDAFRSKIRSLEAFMQPKIIPEVAYKTRALKADYMHFFEKAENTGMITAPMVSITSGCPNWSASERLLRSSSMFWRIVALKPPLSFRNVSDESSCFVSESSCSSIKSVRFPLESVRSVRETASFSLDYPST